MFPNMRVVASPKLTSGQTNMIGWVVPLDDTSFKIFTIARDSDPEFLKKLRSTHEGKAWKDLTEEEHQRLPGDYEAQKSQGDISLHSEDHLTTTDQGVAMLRRMMAKQIKALEKGENPPGVVFDESEIVVAIEGGNYFEDAVAEPATVGA
jgi:hypothetical protein